MNNFWKIVLAVLTLTSYKTIPFAYLFKFYYAYTRYVTSKRWKYLKIGGKNTFDITIEKKGPLAVFEPNVYSSYVSPLEYDMFLHKSNSTYFADMDFARMKLLCQNMQKGFFTYMFNEYNDFKKASVFNYPFVPVARVECTFKKELKLFEKFDVVSRVGAWDDKWLYVISKFVKTSDNRTVAIGVTRYVFKLGRITIPPKEFIKRSELLTSEAEAANEKYLEKFKHFASTDDFEQLCDSF
ncbi:hypothetical protein PSN45_003594 [Yamadazyma tenuis]|uniref:Thioesterase/thiol ester dehydrase-isomerase n=1 Tax=Candida tenuis (strain ATCC 10573 / BCRC 21748 / CBS 615 / JCM 9827 / NBRC 10315 / NRRL Y-1498 / VKM Y-70) TaxID=590646 RepID=G3AZN8_CANTC|nr:uncharacterized protein CANTEDRAFT_112505 [Yamadazyma tenuis ATCC 10573]EGV65632.1 hypothetical protein CANTEDRAFT_112505 [Yamadazyma tenuis ATCC 10573]WEJ96060.1 hypothetical protein PSN45_003594 [Yamadazyma tenuis]